MFGSSSDSEASEPGEELGSSEDCSKAACLGFGSGKYWNALSARRPSPMLRQYPVSGGGFTIIDQQTTPIVSLVPPFPLCDALASHEPPGSQSKSRKCFSMLVQLAHSVLIVGRYTPVNVDKMEYDAD